VIEKEKKGLPAEKEKESRESLRFGPFLRWGKSESSVHLQDQGLEAQVALSRLDSAA